VLTHIHLKQFTIIESLSIDLEHGLTVLTGETGAGKSILIDAVSIGLGGRFDARFMRQNASMCEVVLCFDLTRLTAAKEFLSNQGIEGQSDCIIRRVLTQDGRSKNTINDTPCTVQCIRQLGEHLIHFYGQHAHQALLNTHVQRNFLDRFAANQTLCRQLEACFDRYAALEQEQAVLTEKNQHAVKQLDYFHHLQKEIHALALTADTWDTLSAEHLRYLRAKDSVEHIDQAQMLLTRNDQNIISMLNQVMTALSNIQQSSLDNVMKLLHTADIHLQEAVLELQQHHEGDDFNEQAFLQLDKKLSNIHDLARKHQVEPNKLWEVSQTLTQHIDELNNIGLKLEELLNQKQKVKQEYDCLAAQLTHQRHEAVKQLNQKVTHQLQHLGMMGAVFEINLVKHKKALHRCGNEQVVFMISTNPGQPLAPMQKIVSGGELSRLGLALQVIAQDAASGMSFIFDEVDTGIGGRTAAIVGELLSQLAHHRQVFCITHLPQVASQANQHLSVTKSVSGGYTFASIVELNRDQRIKELARMSTGGKMTESILQHAEALLAEVK
jgi:DNA repair protein RecN (Recombination protein N)